MQIALHAIRAVTDRHAINASRAETLRCLHYHISNILTSNLGQQACMSTYHVGIKAVLVRYLAQL